MYFFNFGVKGFHSKTRDGCAFVGISCVTLLAIEGEAQSENDFVTTERNGGIVTNGKTYYEMKRTTRRVGTSKLKQKLKGQFFLPLIFSFSFSLPQFSSFAPLRKQLAKSKHNISAWEPESSFEDILNKKCHPM